MNALHGWYRRHRGHRLVRAALFILVTAQFGFALAQVMSVMLAHTVWLADLANFIRLHLLIIGVGLLVIGFLLPVRWARIGGVLALASALLPYTLLPSPAPWLGGTPFSVVSANLLVGNPNIEGFMSIPEVTSGDILVLQEVTPDWQDALSQSGLWPFESDRNLRAHSDMKVFSRFEITSEETVSPDSGDTGGRHPRRLELIVDGRPLVLYAVHTQTPRSLSMWRERNAYLRDLELSLHGEPPGAQVIVAGDWNTPSWSPFLTDLLRSTGYRTTESRWWPLPTRFSVRFAALTQLGSPIDRIVVSPDVGLESVTTGPNYGSNHLPVFARLTLP
ncbi:endonuclease/exonuclease/phosphatase family protein [Mesorhizobium sp. CAU 1741]|uniref:endonuclease/exonuclease/phosphatase family protein n=1 Tax=Mesorhizobium sp. CAU 1741 TaxID=3140366 RepID=UPI00325B922F